MKIQITKGLITRTYRTLTPQEEITPGIETFQLSRGGEYEGLLVVRVSRRLNLSPIIGLLSKIFTKR